MKSAVSATLLVLGLLSFSGLAQAQEEVRVRPVDVYISGFGGYSFPFNTDLSVVGVTLRDTKLNNSPSFGGKIGMWITAPRRTLGVDVGAEIDVTNFNPDVPSGQVL